jgi:hypothetical protein
MFETATWTVRNRRNFEIVERIYEQVGLPVMTEEWDLTDQSQFAAALAHEVGSVLLYSLVSAANGRPKKPSSVSKRRERATWKSIDPEGGARASVFLTLGAAAMLSPQIEEGFDPVPIDLARLKLIDEFAPPKEDIANVERVVEEMIVQLGDPLTKEAVARGGTIASEIRNTGQVILTFEALKLAGADPVTTPMYEGVAEVDQAEWFDIFWSMLPSFHWKGAKERLLDIASTPFT